MVDEKILKCCARIQDLEAELLAFKKLSESLGGRVSEQENVLKKYDDAQTAVLGKYPSKAKLLCFQ